MDEVDKAIAWDEIAKKNAEIERLRAAMSWLAGHEPELVEQAREKYKLLN